MEHVITITKVGLLLSTAFQATAAFSPPNPIPLKEARDKYPPEYNGAAVGHTIYAPLTLKYFAWSVALLESSLILFSTDTDSSFAEIMRFIFRSCPINTANLRTVSPSFLSGCGLITAGLIIRLCCYRAMGKLFTFQLALLPEHTLIKHGPYSVVRHPSYTGFLLVVSAFPLVYAGPGSLLFETGGAGVFLVLVAGVCLIARGVRRRSNIEDRVLSKQFGEEWDEWARRVRWKLCPGIF